jgi:ribosomal protein L3
MTRVLQEGKAIPVTIVDVEGCVVSLRDEDLLELRSQKEKREQG